MNEQIILQIIDKFNSSDLTELEYSRENERLLLRKESGAGRSLVAPDEAAPSAVKKAMPAERPARLGFSGQATKTDEDGETITSPIVATFYASAAPDAQPFVRAGSKVKAGDTLCILEAMKMMNHLEAEFDCEILGVEANSGDLVEYGQALFRVKRPD